VALEPLASDLKEWLQFRRGDGSVGGDPDGFLAPHQPPALDILHLSPTLVTHSRASVSVLATSHI